MPNINYFEILEIEPTTDISIVKKAFRKQMMLNHPDKKGDLEKCKKIVEAWEILQDENMLFEHYDLVQTGAGKSSREFVPPEEKRERKPDSPRDSLVPHGAMLNVFIPMFVQRPDDSSEYLIHDDYDLKNMRRDKMTAINPYRFKTDNFDFHALAEIMNFVLETCHYKQIGLDIKEVDTIVNQHSWYKYYGAYFGVSVKVNVADITEKFSEADASPTCLNPGTQAFLSLKKGSRIDVNNITAIYMSSHDNTGMRLAQEHDYIIFKDAKPANKPQPPAASMLALSAAEENSDDAAETKMTASTRMTGTRKHALRFFELPDILDEEEPDVRPVKWCVIL